MSPMFCPSRLLLWAALFAACTPDDVVAKVGSREISRDGLALFQRGLSRAGSVDQTLDSLITRELLAEAAQRQGLARRPDVAARLEAAEREILAQAFVEHVMKDLDTVALKARFESAKATFAYRQVRLAHIFVASAGQAESRINTAWARVLGGEDFAAVAKDLSEDSATASSGGALGAVREGQVPPELFEAAASLKAGEVSKPVHTGSGFHLFKALSSVETVQPSFDEVRGHVEALARREREAQAIERAKAEVSVRRWPERLSAQGQEAAR